jgi:hypothetical protein
MSRWDIHQNVRPARVTVQQSGTRRRCPRPTKEIVAITPALECGWGCERSALPRSGEVEPLFLGNDETLCDKINRLSLHRRCGSAGAANIIAFGNWHHPCVNRATLRDRRPRPPVPAHARLPVPFAESPASRSRGAGTPGLELPGVVVYKVVGMNGCAGERHHASGRLPAGGKRVRCETGNN